MSELKKTTKTTHYVDYRDMAKYLAEKIGRSVEILDSPNDTDYSFEVDFKEESWYDKETFEKFLKDGIISMDYGYGDIFHFCGQRGWLEPGYYVITVSW